ncbi:MAG: hypothetical protein IIZ92_07275 [Aquincola sp.]|nr:hypothetical protein [Aquincola sp.]
MGTLDKLLADFTSVQWWINVWVVGVLVGLVPSYIKPWVDKQISRVSVPYRQRIERLGVERRRLARGVACHDALITLEAARAQSLMSLSIFHMALGLLGVLLLKLYARESAASQLVVGQVHLSPGTAILLAMYLYLLGRGLWYLVAAFRAYRQLHLVRLAVVEQIRLGIRRPSILVDAGERAEPTAPPTPQPGTPDTAPPPPPASAS